MKFAALILMLGFSSIALAHGGGGGGDAKHEEKAAPRVEIRSTPQHPEEMDPDMLEKYLNNKNPFPDVVTILCKIGEYSACRGLEIGLYDMKGKLIAKGHSGTTGSVGFQGLKPHGDFVAKVEGDKYKGESHVHAGGSFGLTAERK